MKIVHVIWSLSYGGAETMLIDILNYQSQNNEVELLIINNNIESSLLDTIDPSVRILRIDRPLKSKSFIHLLKLNITLLFKQCDVVHFHQDNIIRYLPIRRFKKNFCLTIHDKEMDVEDVKKYNYLFAISQIVQQSIEIKCRRDSTLIYNGINIEKIATKNLEEYKANGIFKMVQVSRLMHMHKGQDLLLRAIHQLINKYRFKSFHLDFFGEGNSMKYLKELSEELELNNYVSFLGTKSKMFVQQNLQSYDLLIQPSRWEGFGLVAIEGMAAGIPVLVSNVDGLEEVVQYNKYGYSFEKENIEDLADKIWQIANESVDKITALTTMAYQYVNDNFDISITAANYLRAYQKIKIKF